jgi:hypothetical protein
MERIVKYPRTRHIEGSRLSPGDHDLSAVPFRELAGQPLIVEEKLDGANAAISFAPQGELRLQSRGHYLVGGARERHFELLKSWATAHQSALFRALGARHVMYGEWLYAKHTIHYDALPHYFLEFDVLDREAGEFLSTSRRRALLGGLPVVSVPVLYEGPLRDLETLSRMIAPSLYKTSASVARLREEAERRGLDAERILSETDASPLSEGLYVKVEREGRVEGRFKFVRRSFLTTVLDSGSHWLSRPIVPNSLAPGVDLYAAGTP